MPQRPLATTEPMQQFDTNNSQWSGMVEPFIRACQIHGDKPAFSCNGHSLSFRELDQLSSDFASYLLRDCNLNSGERIAIQLPNILEFPVAAWGALKAGLILVNTNPLYTPRELTHQYQDSGAKALVVLNALLPCVAPVLKESSIEHIIVTDGSDLFSDISAKEYAVPHAVSMSHALHQGRTTDFVPVARQYSDIFALQYTGGTTGVSKGTMLTHGNIKTNTEQMADAMSTLGSNEVFIAPLPLYHIYAFSVHLMTCLFKGCHSILITNPRDLDGFVSTLQKVPFTGLVGINTLMASLLEHSDFKKLDFSKLKHTYAGGAALTLDIATRWKSVTGSDVYEGYGLTETSPVACVNRPGAAKLGTIGFPLKDTLIKLIDDTGNEVAKGEAGELCVKGGQVMKGYWNRPEATAEVLTPDGWLKTGDIALYDSEGYLKIVDRKKDMILVSGFNVYPNEIEDVAGTHPDILECAAVGVEDTKSGEAVKLFVVSGNKALTSVAVKDYCRQQLTAYKTPKFVDFKDELPKSSVGKILRRELRDQ
jgi:long-chain acyl-CoA synthetase